MSLNRSKLAEVNARIERGEFADGHYFCGCCQHITELDLDHEVAKCVLCGSSRVRWQGACTRPAMEPNPKPSG